MDLKRLYIFTGKGGVGKTTLSLSFTKCYSDSYKVKYVYFKSSSLSQHSPHPESILQEANKMGIDVVGLDLAKAAQTYIGRKLRSPTLGKWVVKTPFFKALINMIPGFNYLIYLGQILDSLNEDPELIYVLDSPSSGHALTMLEAVYNFSEIFQSGTVFEDTKKMIRLLNKENFLKINILTIPTEMSVKESQELELSLQQIAKIQTATICNTSLKSIENISSIKPPPSLQVKIDNEQEIINKHGHLINYFIPYSTSNTPSQLIKDLVPSTKNLV